MIIPHESQQGDPNEKSQEIGEIEADVDQIGMWAGVCRGCPVQLEEAFLSRRICFDTFLIRSLIFVRGMDGLVHGDYFAATGGFTGVTGQ